MADSERLGGGSSIERSGASDISPTGGHVATAGSPAPVHPTDGSVARAGSTADNAGAGEDPAPDDAPVAQDSTSGDTWGEFMDAAWDFFASVRVAVVLIVLVAAASTLGTLIEQESLYQDWRPPELYYPARYGPTLGPLLMKLGLTHTYSSVWFAGLVLMLVISLIICSLHRLVPLHRVLTRPLVWKQSFVLKRQQLTAERTTDLESVASRLKSRGFRIYRDRECLLAEKGRLSRYGPYIIHIGLIFVAMAAFAKAVPGWDLSRDVWVPDGQTVKVPDTDFAITSHKFTMQLYDNGMPSLYSTDAGVVQNGKEVVRSTIEVNHPLSFEGWDIYQASYRQEPGVAHVTVMTSAGQAVSDLAIDLRQPETEYQVNDHLKMVVDSYYHDFTVDPQTKEPTNGSFEVKNPVFMVEFQEIPAAVPVASAGGQAPTVLGRAALMVMGHAQPFYQGSYYLAMDKLDTRWFTALKLHKDRTTPYMFGGLAVVLIGMYITFFMFHWQIWAREENGRIILGAHAHKNKFSLKQEIKALPGRQEGEEL